MKILPVFLLNSAAPNKSISAYIERGNIQRFLKMRPLIMKGIMNLMQLSQFEMRAININSLLLGKLGS